MAVLLLRRLVGRGMRIHGCESFHHATDVPFAVTYGTQVEYVTDQANPVGRVFVPLMVAALLSRRKANCNTTRGILLAMGTQPLSSEVRHRIEGK